MHMKILASGYNNSLFDSIYECELSEDGKLISLETINGVENPNFLCMSKDGQRLYSVVMTKNTMGLAAFSHDPDGYRLIGSISFPGDSICHLSLNESEGLIACTCYGSGDVYFFSLDENRVPSKLVSHFCYSESNIVSHPHCIISSKNEKYMYAVDLGRDRVVTYDVSGGEVRECAFLKLQPGDGPRHIMHHPDLPIMYMITEYSNIMYVISSDERTGELKVIQRLSTLKGDFTDISYGASLCYSGTHSLLYGTNRGANTIVVFEVSQGGMIKYITEVDCGGIWPRHIELSEDERFVFVANQRSDTLNIIPVSEDGIPTKTVTKIHLRQASFVMHT